ncbi:putative Tetrahaem cytochrome c [Candidatus Nitrospira nitrosa]|uniref:Putative Tetrahaem cytochrome c n=2 Tax=Candidatus Nitrospira nitrosa TaxID=1742972 RepID=A0A0S4L572_9BACT|nr:putative Tetrahaem cytochrome c [Candidatus Nitrospira nitrosa]
MGLQGMRRRMATAVTLAAGLLVLFQDPSLASDQSHAKDLLQQTCVQCHRLEGTADSRFNLRAPDLIWAGSKYQRSWLIRWLTGKEAPLYVKGYRWDLTDVSAKHPVVTEGEASAIADYFAEHNKDPRVTVGAFDLSKVTKFDVAFGGVAYKAHACLGCHTIEENGKLIGGQQSAALQKSGQRYDKDWLFRFGLNPQDFVPHSGEFLADATEPQLRAVIGYLMVQGAPDFQYYEPWTSPEFSQADAGRGKVLYKEYCAQCHGLTGKGDGPAASGLEPKPAIHANMPFDKLPMEYLYTVINHGGVAVGKSPNMPYWGLTIGQQGVADVIAYLKVTFKGIPEVPAAAGGQSGACVQSRKTAKAPDTFLTKTNPLSSSAGAIKAGKELFLKTAQPVACVMCHGEQGDGKGLMGAALMPPPRNFTCGAMMRDISDGQLFWIIKNGSPGTGMMSFASLPDEQVWQLIHYIRSLAK